ncbi:hypothetical protein, partial [Salmonella enterica]|uniref:hypothetical protein n=1 Tax=Salmonella enterica TaxID=28901 RepID=UPI001C388E43
RWILSSTTNSIRFQNSLLPVIFSDDKTHRIQTAMRKVSVCCYYQRQRLAHTVRPSIIPARR